ncbi:ABC transporter permease [Noviherbaspirillum sp. CPCC 100848]|uniref:ABC transporter permease n=1 Tax=Noviherbaspirillum album TaxID=3080276 RepID=A0ABU6J2P6_9BURK|nr:ABC transporter permease [Noviherbaspirillum sp. CPCC 100848]MEC4717909.1 ABC transporter permease [Noviherbaspirillum sp. CPCC 100848]
MTPSPETGTPLSTSMNTPASTPLRKFLSAYFESRLALLGLILLAAILCAAVLAPWIAMQDPYDLAQLDISDARRAPGSPASDGLRHYLLGTDEQGRDMLSAILYGLRVSLFVGVSATLIALSIGMTLGLIAGYVGGKVDAFIMRIADLQLSFPAILIALVLLAILGKGTGKIIIALVAVQWAYYARTTRGVAIVERQKEYIDAAILLGLPVTRILFRHLLPNCLPPLVVVATLQVAAAIALEATLSFLGVGLPVTEPSLGLLIANGFQYLLTGKYWISFFPGAALLLTLVAINLVADRLRDVINPRLQVH